MSGCEGDLGNSSGVDGAGDRPAGCQRAFRLTIAYDGSRYFGWQRQASRPTIQQVVEDALSRLLGEERVVVTGSSRTDTGVHAIGQVARFVTSNWRAPADRLAFALNTMLPEDIVIRRSEDVPLSFHPLRDCAGKWYRYRVYNAPVADPIGRTTHWWVRRPLKVEAMRAAAAHLLGTHDFASFQSTGSPRVSTVRSVRRLEITQRDHLDGQLFEIDIEADGFLYNMVRNIAGTLVKVGAGREDPDWVRMVLQARDRKAAGVAAPPQGLCLMKVFFTEEKPPCESRM